MHDLGGLLLTGGTDVSPARYGQSRDPSTEEPDPSRDELEATLLEQALREQLPVLAICRGMQLFNVVRGGTLIQNLKTAINHTQKPMPDWEAGRHPAAHSVQVRTNTALASIIGPGEHAVNSRHHQGVDQIGRGMVAAARSSDGIVEALEAPDHPFAIAVQWHPEDRIHVNPADRRLFEAFACAVQTIRTR